MVEHTADMLRYPYGLSYSCFESYQGVFIFNSKLPLDEISKTVPAVAEDGSGIIEKPIYSDEEKFANKLMVINNIFTNLLFNLGYMYSDVANYVTLEQASLKYWSRVGEMIGDFMIRFWYKEDFKKTFVFERIDDCDLTADQQN